MPSMCQSGRPWTSAKLMLVSGELEFAVWGMCFKLVGAALTLPGTSCACHI